MQQGYAASFGKFVIDYLFVFVLGVLFGEVMKATGVAEVLGKEALHLKMCPNML